MCVCHVLIKSYLLTYLLTFAALAKKLLTLMLTRDLFVVSNLVTAGFTTGLYLAEIQFTGKNGILNDVTITSSFRSAVLIGFSVT